MSTENLPATRAQLQAMRDLSIPFDLDHLPTFDDAARLIREAEEAENPMRVVMGPPVRDIREAMHPDPLAAMLKDAGPFPPVPAVERRLVGLAHGPTIWEVAGSVVATLPDGTRVNLPAGTVLREGEDARPNTADAIGLLRKARALIGSAIGIDADHAFRDLSEIDAFLVREGAGTAPPEHPLFALVRSFVGKPGDKPGPVWTALMCVQARLDDDDLAGAKAAATALEEALNERLGQMHDALGRDPIAEVSR